MFEKIIRKIQGAKNIQEESLTDTEYALNIYNRQLEIWFMGSSILPHWKENPWSIIDWVFNLMKFKVSYPWGRVHAGFALKYHAVRLNIYDYLKANKGKYDFITIYGFSQGAGIGKVCLMDLIHTFDFENIDGIFGGDPLCYGKSDFVDRNKDKMISYCTYWDIVGHLPFGILGYKRYAQKIKFGEKKFKLITHMDYLKQAKWEDQKNA
jgi:hypothetical protein